MSNLSNYFDYDAVPTDEFQPLTPGVYQMIVAGDSVDTKIDDNGIQSVVMTLSWVVTQGEGEGRTCRDRFTLSTTNPGEGAQINVKISHQRLKKLCDAMNIRNLRDSAELKGKSALLDIGLQKKNPKYNEVFGYAPVVTVQRQAVESPTDHQRQAPRPAPTQSSKPRASWMKPKTTDEAPFQ